MKKQTLLVLFASMVYTSLRYMVFGPYDLNQFPVFLVNKALSFSAVLCWFVGGVHYFKSVDSRGKQWNHIAFHLTILHVLLSLSVFSPSYYSKWFLDQTLTYAGELSLLFGVLGFYVMVLIRFKMRCMLAKPTLKIVLYLLVACHLWFMGWNGWLTVSKWHGHMPPISLLCFVLVLGSIALHLTQLRNQSSKPT